MQVDLHVVSVGVNMNGRLTHLLLIVRSLTFSNAHVMHVKFMSGDNVVEVDVLVGLHFRFKIMN